jgi:uncharacterized protein
MITEFDPDAFLGKQLHPRAVKGFRHFNNGEFFEAHEELEAAWKDEPGPIRDLYRGILQVAVACYHLERGNLVGARKMLLRSRQWLTPFPDMVLGIHVGQFRRDAQELEYYLLNDPTNKKIPVIKPIQFQ